MAVCVGGTFDILHRGHKALLQFAAELVYTEPSDPQLIVGITADMWAQQRKSYKVAPVDTRIKAVRNFLAQYELPRITTMLVSDGQGPAASWANVRHLVVGQDLKEQAMSINGIRRARSLSELQVHVIQMVYAKDDREIHASRIHAGEIDADGNVCRKAEVPLLGP